MAFGSLIRAIFDGLPDSKRFFHQCLSLDAVHWRRIMDLVPFSLVVVHTLL